MKKKITITIEETAVKLAKVRAKEENRNISNYIETLIVNDEMLSHCFYNDDKVEV